MIERVVASDTYILRHEVLGRGVAPADVAAADDADPDSGHFAVKVDGKVVATGTVGRRSSADGVSEPHGQIRGMAVDPMMRRQGFGAAVLAALIDHVAERGGGYLWCHARLQARSLYERHGFTCDGDAFEDAVAGPQILMSRNVAGI